MHRLLCFKRWTEYKVYVKADMGERRKMLNIWLKRTRYRGGVESTRLEAKDTKKYPRPKTAFWGQTLGQGHRRKCSPKKIIIRFSIFFSGVLKKRNQKISKKKFFYKKRSTKFQGFQKYCRSQAEDRAIFEDLKLRGQGLQNVSSRAPPL